MTDENGPHMMEMAREIAVIAKLQGSSDFPCLGETLALESSGFCGLTAFFDNGAVFRLKAIDMDLVIEGASPFSQGSIRFRKGGFAQLAAWRQRFASLNRYFCPEAYLLTGSEAA